MLRVGLLTSRFCAALCAFLVAVPAARIAAAPSPSPDAGGAGKAAAPPASPGPARSTVTVRVQGLRHERGKVFVALYDSKRSFAQKQGYAAGAIVAAKDGGAVVVFSDVVPGRYAIAFFQDENGNQKLDTSLLGAPTEPFGFSKDAMGKFGPPSFDAAAIDVPAGSVSAVINARHL